MKTTTPPTTEAPWALTGAKGRPPRLVKSLYLKDGEMTVHNWKLYEKYCLLKKNEVKVEINCPPECSLIVVAFGSCSRIVRTAVDRARKRGITVGLIRPITLFPFPENEIREAAAMAGRVLVIEMNTGQMVDDVRLACNGNSAVSFRGYPGGEIPTPEQVENEIELALQQEGAKICQI